MISRYIGQRIMKVRRARGFTQKELEARAELPKGMAHKYESGRSRITLEAFLRICQALWINPSEMLGHVWSTEWDETGIPIGETK